MSDLRFYFLGTGMINHRHAKIVSGVPVDQERQDGNAQGGAGTLHAGPIAVE